jgi:Arc/MetJ-type ribon-helix-helix transcriptional regulator
MIRERHCDHVEPTAYPSRTSYLRAAIEKMKKRAAADNAHQVSGVATRSGRLEDRRTASDFGPMLRVWDQWATRDRW